MVLSSKSLENVTVVGSRQDKTFNNAHTGSQEIINREQIERLPTINRSLQDFTKLEPTSNSTSFGQSFGGRSAQYNNITVGGANFNNSFGLSGTLGGQTNSQPISLEALDQIQVNVSPYDVRQGGFSGAGINSVVKSGTNQFKGSVYSYIRGASTQGYHVETNILPKTPITYNILGGSLGGAIIKNKLFFFVSGESVRQTLPATSWVASDPSHTPGNNISQADTATLGTLSRFLQTNYNYNPGPYQGYNFQTNSDKITAKIDWNISPKNSFSVSYFYLKSNADQFASTSRPGSGQVTGGQPGSSSMPFFGSGYVINNNFNIVIGELNTRFSNRSSNKMQVGYTALRDFRTPHSSSSTFPLVDILGGTSTSPILTTFGYEMYTYNNKLNTNVFQFSDIFTHYIGSHEITIGTQDYSRKYQNAFAPGYQGVYQFSSLSDFYNNAPAASYYLQYSALPGGSFPWAYAGSTELGFFAQDKWRATTNFTLTYGLRYDMTIYKQTFQDNPNFDALTFKNGATYNIGQAPGNAIILSPRIGFNWDAKGDKSIQIRGGLGSFSGPPPFVWLSNQASNNGIQFGSFTNKTTNVFNQNPTTYIPASGSPNTSYSIAITDHGFKYPTVLKSGLAVDKKLGNGFIVTVEGTYSKDINAVYYSNINLNESNGFALNGTDARTRYNTAFNANGTDGSSQTTNNSNKYYFGSTLANPNLGTGILMKNSNKGYSYTATFRIQKQFKKLFLSAAYTYAQSKNVAAGGSTASSLWSGRPVGNADPNSPNLAYSDYYQPNRVIAFASYKISYGKYFSTTIGAVFEAAPAGVFSYVYSGDLNGDGNTGNDLMYIPQSSKDINLISVNSYNKTTHTGNTTGLTSTGNPYTYSSNGVTYTDVRTQAQIWNQLNNFINQDHYLSSHRGQYAQANAVVEPFFKNLDLNITEDISLKTGKGEKDRHTLRLTLDLINVGNFLNRNWGLKKFYNLNNPLKFEGMAADGKTPLFSMPFIDAKNQVPLVNTYTNNTGITSRWQMQFGIKYLFN